MVRDRGTGAGVTFTLLTKQNCPLCDHAKEVLGHVSADFVSQTEIVWLERPEGEEFVRAHDTPFPPVLLIDGQLHGFGRLSEKKLRRDLDRRGSARRSMWERFRRSVSGSVE